MSCLTDKKQLTIYVSKEDYALIQRAAAKRKIPKCRILEEALAPVLKNLRKDDQA